MEETRLLSSAFNSAILLLTPIFIVVLSLHHLWRRRGTNYPPSPPAVPILGHLHHLKKPIHRSLANLSYLHGPILSLRLGSRPVLLVSSASAAEECFSGSNDLAFANRPRFLAGKHLGYGYTSVLWAPHGPLWRDLRRVISAEVLSATHMESSAWMREQEVAAMVKSVAEDSLLSGGTPLEIRARLFHHNLNLLIGIVAGTRVENSGQFLKLLEESFAVSGASNLSDFLPALSRLFCTGFEKRLAALHMKKDEFLKELVEERRRETSFDESREERKCFIDMLLLLQKSNSEKYSDDIIKGLSLAILAAGTDTSALTIEWALAMLLCHPAAMAKARAEVDSCIGHDRLINESDLPKLPYLRAVIKESQRLHPVAAIIPAHESFEECTVGGYRVPAGTTLLVNAWAIQRDPSLWSDPEAFVPERWGEETVGGNKRQDKTLFFGLGRRRCPGEGLAMRVVGLWLGALLQCFDWEVGLGEQVDLSEGAGLSMPMAKPLRAYCKHRHFLKNVIGV